MSNKIVQPLLLLIIGVVFYFSWLSDPSLVNQTYLLNWLLNWSNQYYDLRTGIPFIAIGFLLEVYTQHKNSFVKRQDKNVIFIENLSFATMIVCIVEAGQLFIKRRSPNLFDIFFGVTESLIEALFYNLFKKLRNAK